MGRNSRGSKGDLFGAAIGLAIVYGVSQGASGGKDVFGLAVSIITSILIWGGGALAVVLISRLLYQSWVDRSDIESSPSGDEGRWQPPTFQPNSHPPLSNSRDLPTSASNMYEPVAPAVPTLQPGYVVRCRKSKNPGGLCPTYMA